MSDRHETESVALADGAEASVDVEIAPLVRWLNSHRGVRTVSCCQGDPGPDENFRGIVRLPYVSFVCEDTESLATLLRSANRAEPFYDEYGSCEIMVKEPAGRGFLYVIRWDRKETMLSTTRGVIG